MAGAFEKFGKFRDIGTTAPKQPRQRVTTRINADWVEAFVSIRVAMAALNSPWLSSQYLT